MIDALVPRQYLRPILLRPVVDNGGFLEIAGPLGTCRLTVSESERSALLGLLHSWDGRTQWDDCDIGELGDDLAVDVLRALVQVGAAAPDSSSLWAWFARVSGNPGAYQPPLKVEEAYALPVPQPFRHWPGGFVEPMGQPRPEDAFLLCRTRSLGLDRVDGARAAELREVAVELGNLAVRRQADGHRFYSSAGAMFPVALAALVPNPHTAGFDLVTYDADGARVASSRELAVAEVVECFLRDDALNEALEQRPIIFVHVADCRRSAAKYGSRAWLYAAVEAGQINHRIELAANRRGLMSRPVGGFCEEPLVELLRLEEALPLLTTFVAHEW